MGVPKSEGTVFARRTSRTCGGAGVARRGDLGDCSPALQSTSTQCGACVAKKCSQ